MRGVVLGEVPRRFVWPAGCRASSFARDRSEVYLKRALFARVDTELSSTLGLAAPERLGGRSRLGRANLIERFAGALAHLLV